MVAGIKATSKSLELWDAPRMAELEEAAAASEERGLEPYKLDISMDLKRATASGTSKAGVGGHNDQPPEHALILHYKVALPAARGEPQQFELCSPRPAPHEAAAILGILTCRKEDGQGFWMLYEDCANLEKPECESTLDWVSAKDRHGNLVAINGHGDTRMVCCRTSCTLEVRIKFVRYLTVDFVQPFAKLPVRDQALKISLLEIADKTGDLNLICKVRLRPVAA